MRSAEQWFTEYDQTHRHPRNQVIHKICVPVIFWSVFAVLWTLPVPAGLAAIQSWLNWCSLALFLVLLFYLSLGVQYFVEMLLISGLLVAVNLAIEWAGAPLAALAIVSFVLGWIGQFYGHKIEGKKPSFFADLLFLLIGPLWVVESFKNKLRTG